LLNPTGGAALERGRIIVGILCCSDPTGHVILNDLYGAEVIQNQLTPSWMPWKMNVLDQGVLNGVLS